MNKWNDSWWDTAYNGAIANLKIGFNNSDDDDEESLKKQKKDKKMKKQQLK